MAATVANDGQPVPSVGDGCLLMNLGCLVTIVASGARNLTVVALENGIYEVTGGQRTAARSSTRRAASLIRSDDDRSEVLDF